MDEGKFVADFVANNLGKIYSLGKKSLKEADQSLKLKMKTAYTEYLIITRNKYSKSKSFFIRNESVDLYTYYEPISISSGNFVINKPNISECVKNSKRIVIMGTGGTGKSVLMKHLFLNCIKEKNYTPVLIELRDLNSANKKLLDYINFTLESFEFKLSEEYIKKAMKDGHFAFFLDGYDEVNHSIRKKLLKQIKNLSNSFPDCPIFISTRPDDVFQGIDDFKIFKIDPLTLKSAIKLINKLPYDEEIKDKFSNDLKNKLFNKHASFLSNPLLLSIMLLTYGENAEIPSKLSVFYNQAYEALFQRHDANKGGYKRVRLTTLDIQDFSRVFALFCLQTYEKRFFKMSRSTCIDYIKKSKKKLCFNFEEEYYLDDLLSSACLLMEEGLEIAFSHRSFQEYFVSLQISNSQPEVQEKLIKRYLQNINQDDVFNLLLEINPELTERLLLIPQLEKLFKLLKVNNKIGITHAYRYFKYSYSEINCPDDNQVTLTLTDNGSIMSNIVRMSVENYSDYIFMNKKGIKELTDYYKEKYFVDVSVYTKENINSRSPIMTDLLKGKSISSIEYLGCCFKAYKKLKKKHENTMEDLDMLLDL